MFNPDGTLTYNNFIEMQYDLFSTIGLGINRDCLIYDQDTSTLIQMGGKYIKASVCGEPIYVGKDAIPFDPAKNYKLITYLFCHFLDKAQMSDDGDILGGYVSHFIDDNPEKDKQAVVVRTTMKGDIRSRFYYNIYLAYIDCILRIDGYNPDLSNFDILEEPKK